MSSPLRLLNRFVPVSSFNRFASVSRASRKISTTTDGLHKTAIYDLHLELGGKMVPFAGYSMPVQYPDGIKESHLWVRSNAGLFDVSHMGQVRVIGQDRVAFVESLVVGGIGSLTKGHATLSLITNENGGIIDDTIVTNLGDEIGMVINGACKEKDLKHMRKHLADARAAGKDVDIIHMEEHQLYALQGPKAMDALAKFVPKESLVKMPFMFAAPMDILGERCLVSRCGYTGEDGFEISVSYGLAKKFFTSFCDLPEVRPVGLGARDSLRLEAGLCLYGNDIDDTTSPVEAGLLWTIPKTRRESGGFLGADVVKKHIKDGVSRRRVGFFSKGAPARGHEDIVTESGEKVGMVTSGGFSPSLGHPIGMGYINKPYDTPVSKGGKPLFVVVRGKKNPMEIEKMPFIPSKYYKVPE